MIVSVKGRAFYSTGCVGLDGMMKDASNHHPVHTNQEMAAAVRAYRRSGQRFKRFALEQGIPRGRLHYWAYQKDRDPKPRSRIEERRSTPRGIPPRAADSLFSADDPRVETPQQLNLGDMKTRFSNQTGVLNILFMAACTALPVTSAQTQELDIQTYAGVTIIGDIGKVYSIEYVTDLTDPAESDWRCLEYLQLPASPYLWADKSAPATGKRFYRAVAKEAPENMVFIPPRTFRMGSPENEEGRWDAEGPQTDVTISRGFWMGKYEVTQGEYEAVMGSNPSCFNGTRQVWDEE